MVGDGWWLVGVTFRIFTAGKEARRLMALLQASAKPSLPWWFRCPAHPCTCLPNNPWQLPPATDHIGLISNQPQPESSLFTRKASLWPRHWSHYSQYSLWLLFTGGWWRAVTHVDTWPRWRGEVALPAKCQHLRGKAFVYLPITACSLLPLPSSLPLAPWQLPREQPLRGAPRPDPYSPLGGLAPYTPGPSGPNHTPYACPWAPPVWWGMGGRPPHGVLSTSPPSVLAVARPGWPGKAGGPGGAGRAEAAEPAGPLLLSISTPRLTATYTKDHTDLRYTSPDVFPDQQLIVHATRLWVSAMEGLIKSGKHQWKRTWAFSGFLPAIKSAVHPLNEWNKIKGAESAVAAAVDSIPWLRNLMKQTNTKSSKPFKDIKFVHVSVLYSRKDCEIQTCIKSVFDASMWPYLN